MLRIERAARDALEALVGARFAEGLALGKGLYAIDPDVHHAGLHLQPRGKDYSAAWRVAMPFSVNSCCSSLA